MQLVQYWPSSRFNQHSIFLVCKERYSRTWVHSVGTALCPLTFDKKKRRQLWTGTIHNQRWCHSYGSTLSHLSISTGPRTLTTHQSVHPLHQLETSHSWRKMSHDHTHTHTHQRSASQVKLMSSQTSAMFVHQLFIWTSCFVAVLFCTVMSFIKCDCYCLKVPVPVPVPVPGGQQTAAGAEGILFLRWTNLFSWIRTFLFLCQIHSEE